MAVEFHDYTIKVKAELNNAIIAGLEEAAGELKSQAIRNTPVGKVNNGARTKTKWQHKVVDSELTAYIGNDAETAIWLEFGTGEYAIPNPEGKGSRKGGWYIPIGSGENMISEKAVKAYGFKVVKGKNGMKFAHTYGMKPQRPFWNAYTKKKNQLIKILQNKLKGL
jgi:hypothetical protein